MSSSGMKTVLAQGALIQVLQGLGKHQGALIQVLQGLGHKKIARAWNRCNKIAG